jgi:putative acetyltransferase
MLIIRSENKQDYAAVYEVNKLAFDGRDSEPRLVEAIRQSPEYIPDLSLVAIEDDCVVGYILFSRIRIKTGTGDIPAISLAPLAVRPEYQNKGIGSALVKQGLKECTRLGHKIVIVLGHPDYYPRFGFGSAAAAGIKCPFDVPDEAWMALELQPGAMDGVVGEAHYPPAFDNV